MVDLSLQNYCYLWIWQNFRLGKTKSQNADFQHLVILAIGKVYAGRIVSPANL